MAVDLGQMTAESKQTLQSEEYREQAAKGLSKAIDSTTNGHRESATDDRNPLTTDRSGQGSTTAQGHGDISSEDMGLLYRIDERPPWFFLVMFAMQVCRGFNLKNIT